MSASRPAAPHAIVLLSGGLDSATTLAIAIERGFDAHCMTFDYGQRHAIEVERAREVARRAAVEHRVVALDLGFVGSALTDPSREIPRGRSDDDIGRGIPPTYVPARNTIFLAMALGWAESLGARDVFLGANAVDYSGYPDCRPEFLAAFEQLAALGTKAGVEGRGVRVHAPLLRWSKARIVAEAVRLGVDLASTLSCYAPDAVGRPCGTCDSCRLRERGFREAGVTDPTAAPG